MLRPSDWIRRNRWLLPRLFAALLAVPVLLLAPAERGGNSVYAQEAGAKEGEVQEASEPARAEQDPRSHGVEQWVMRLGHQQYSIREHAAEKLLRAGAVALPALERGSRHSDREIRFRCERILSVVRENEMSNRLEAFLSDHDPQKDYGLSGWKYVQVKLGNTPETRSLFVDMYQSEPELLSACEKGGKSIQEMLSDRVRALEQHLQLFPQDMPIGSAATMLMLAADDRVQYNMNAGRLVYSFSQFPAFRASVTAGTHRELLRSMMEIGRAHV